MGTFGQLSVCLNLLELVVGVMNSENAIQHLASSTHTATVKGFWSEHGADAADRHLFSISNEVLMKVRMPLISD